MPKRTDINKILVIGSGPIVIGQAAEFDYAGTQACFALKEEGYEVVLINSNPATIMTDRKMADKIYIEPITEEMVSKILYEEKPDAILPSLGGQTGLNMALTLDASGILEELDIELIGTNLKAIDQAEDRELFKNLMTSIGQPVPDSTIVHTVDEAVDFANEIGYPIIVRPAFTMGGSGGGICEDQASLEKIVKNGLILSPVTQCLIEKSIAGYQEIEYEVMRDGAGVAKVITSMENFDPVGVHTGDSIVFAPNQSLDQAQNDMLADVAIKIIQALEIEGGCNVQLALKPDTQEYYIIEVNPRVSRSSALASKATGFPIARVAAKIAVGYRFDELYNPYTETTFSEYDPKNITYTVAKVPRWSSDKFKNADRSLTTQMKATGEVMSLGQSIEEALLKSIQSLDNGHLHLFDVDAAKASDEKILKEIVEVKDDRIFYLAEAIRRGMTVEEAEDHTKIRPLFLQAIKHIVDIEAALKDQPLDKDVVAEAKLNGFDDETIAQLAKVTVNEVKSFRDEHALVPNFLPVTIWGMGDYGEAGYYFTSYAGENKVHTATDKESVLVLGSGPIRIGQGIEFDYATVHCVKALQKAGYEALIINSNPETVSTDFSISDKLFFEPVTFENVMAIIEREQPIGVMIQFGGQTAINLANDLKEAGIQILGTSVEDMNRAEDRKLFEQALTQLNIAQPEGATTLTLEEALAIPEKIGGYPVLVRPSFVLGGRGMEVVYDEENLTTYMNDALVESHKLKQEAPILIDHYVQGIEVEVDAICDGTDVFIPGIMEHIEAAGVHSGDSMAVFPTQRLSQAVIDQIIDETIKIGNGLGTIGMVNIQFIVENDKVFIIEVNPRASRTVPFLSKVTDIEIAQIATNVIMGTSLQAQGYTSGVFDYTDDQVHVKAPVFSFTKLNGVDPAVSPEMKSTGEVMGSGKTYAIALQRAFEGANIQATEDGAIVFNLFKADLGEIEADLTNLHKAGYPLAIYINDADEKLESDNFTVFSNTDELNQYITENDVQLVVDTTGNVPGYEKGLATRLTAISQLASLFTHLDTFKAYTKVLDEKAVGAKV